MVYSFIQTEPTRHCFLYFSLFHMTFSPYIFIIYLIMPIILITYFMALRTSFMWILLVRINLCFNIHEDSKRYFTNVWMARHYGGLYCFAERDNTREQKETVIQQINITAITLTPLFSKNAKISLCCIKYIK